MDLFKTVNSCTRIKFKYIHIYDYYMQPRIAVHGGASNTDMNDEMQEKIEKLTEEGYELLEDGEMSVDVVEHIANELESDPRFNAGRGAKLDLDGVPRTEAGIMKHNMDMGAVIGLEKIKNATSVARTIMNESNNSMIGGSQGTKFALEYGFEQEDLKTDKSISIWNDVRSQIESISYTDQVSELKEIDPKEGGTIGCVALDKNGKLASATSTGGRAYQLPGRIGDTPLVGCGFYCNDKVAVSTTGVGEAIMKIQLARDVFVEYEKTGDIEDAVQRSLDKLDKNTDGKAGIIAVTSNRDVTYGYNTNTMYSATK